MFKFNFNAFLSKKNDTFGLNKKKKMYLYVEKCIHRILFILYTRNGKYIPAILFFQCSWIFTRILKNKKENMNLFRKLIFYFKIY